MNLLQSWRTAYQDIEKECPWPGPRPLSIDKDLENTWRFVGRLGEIRQFLQAVDEHSLIILHGATGTGKSSLLDMGLTTILRQSGYVPLVCGQWENIDESLPESFIATQLREQGRLPSPVGELLDDTMGGLTRALDEVYDGRAVLILDQFEELIRHKRQNFVELVQWLLTVNRSRRTRVVLSLRSEYIFELAGLMRDARPFSTAYVELGPISGLREIEDVITGPNRAGYESISDEAAAQLMTAWKDLPAESRERSLLYLHALLYALFWNARADGRSSVTTGDVDDLRRRAQELGSNLFEAGFDRTIKVKLDTCSKACESLQGEVRGVLIAGATEQIRKSVIHLSSGGYKLEQNLWDLFRLTCERELATLCVDPGTPGITLMDAETLVAAATRTEGLDVLSATRPELLERAGLQVPVAHTDVALAAMGVHPVPWRCDPDDLTAGAMLGFEPWEVLVEQVRAFAFAIEWLRYASILRVSPGGHAANLIHDGFGIALKNWSSHRGIQPAVATASLTAFNGERWAWAATGYPEFDGDDGWKYLVNLRWRRCEITADFRRVIFVNCDFRGTQFLNCHFEAVSFVNCLLDGASLEECAFAGKSPDHVNDRPPYLLEGANADRLPEFVIPVDDDVIGDLNHYRGTAISEKPLLYSPTSGVAAIPWTDDVPTKVAWVPPTGGLSMYGGRLSSLTIRACDFREGSVTFAHIAGSSLDFVEQDSADVTLSWCAVLGFSLSNRLDQVARKDAIRVHMTECVLANTWLGPDLSGTVTFDDCVLFSLTNVSAPHDLKVDVINSTYGEVFNVTSVSGTELATDPGADNEPGESVQATISRLVAASHRMAYRSTPAQVELERRAAALSE